MENEQGLNRDIARALLRPAESPGVVLEDSERSWSHQALIDETTQTLHDDSDPVHTELWYSPLLRIWDDFSGSLPQEDGRMLARDHRAPLDTRSSRKTSLAIHVDHKQWTRTPYISFTSLSARIAKLASTRKNDRGRGTQRLTLVDPRRRLSLGLPIINAWKEMSHYGIPDPYIQSGARPGAYYQDEYLCLWEVTPEEVVQTWRWDELSTVWRWYEKIVEPCLRRFQQSRLPVPLLTQTPVTTPDTEDSLEEAASTDDESKVHSPVDENHDSDGLDQENEGTHIDEVAEMMENRLTIAP